MAEATAEELGVRIRRALRDEHTLLWLPDLTSDLADAAWRRLANGLTSASYGTARMLCEDPEEHRNVVVELNVTSHVEEGRATIPVELLQDDLARQCAGDQLRFFSAEEVLSSAVFVPLLEALALLNTVSTVIPTIGSLVRALHLIDPQNDELDISFSKPRLPFSAFVSVPGPRARASSLRIAEALLHEAMHLQLSLVEAIVPLVRETPSSFFSPWRNEYRTAQGILHALYVFRAIDAFLDRARIEGPTSGMLRDHAAERRTTIAQQVHDIRDFRECKDLTADGAAFVDLLLAH
jgi:HEXXH motif-containing protein